MPPKSIRSCIETYVSKYPENSGKQSLLTRFDSVVAKGINEFQAARDIILDEHKSLFKSLNDVKTRAGIAADIYQRPGEANLTEVNNAFNEKKNKAISEVEKVHQEEMDKIEEKRKKKEAQRQQKAKEKEDKVKELEQKAKEKEQAKKEAVEKEKEEKQVKREPTKYQQDIKAITEQFGVYPNTNMPVPGFNEQTAERIYRATRRIKNPRMQAEEIQKILREAAVAAEIKEKKSLSPNIPKEGGGKEAGTGTSTLSNLPGEVKPTDADIMAVEGFETILQATANWDGSPRKELNASANRTIGEVRKELDNPLVEIKPEVISMLENKNEPDEGVDTNSHTYLFDLMTNAEASQDQRGVAASLIAAHRISAGNTWLATAFRAAGKKVTVVFNDNPNSNIISATDRGNVTINAYKIGLRLDEFGGEKRFFSWLEMALYEEVFHLATFKVSNEEEITQIGKELSERERQIVESIYGEKLDDYGAGLEYVRQIMQHSLFGTATELLKAKAYGERSGSKIKEFFSKMLKFIKDIFETSKFPNEKLAKEVVKRIEDYLGITDPNERFKTPKQQLAEQPKLTLFETPDDEKPVMQLTYKNRQYLMQERKLQSGKAIFEVEKTPDGDFVPVNYGMNEVPGLLGANFSEAMQTIMRRGGRGVEMGVSEEKIAGTSEEKSPKFDINSVFSQSLIDKAISYAKDFTKDGTGIERLPEEAEQGRRSSGPINAEATIITSRIIKAGEDAGRAAQERRSYAVEESIKWAQKVVDLAGESFGPALRIAINSGADISKTKAVSQDHQNAINRYIRYSKEVNDLTEQIQILPHKIQKAQERALIQYATQSGLMVQDSDFSNPAHKHGTEAAIYLQKPTGFVTKLKKPDAMYGYWVNLFDSIALHNTLYPSTKYTIKGFYELPFYDDNVSDGNLRVVLQQQFFEDSGEDVKNAVQEDMRAAGFEGEREGPYNKGSVEVDDLHAENVWVVVNKETGEKVLIYIDPKVKWTGKVNEDYLDRQFGASEFKGTPEITEEERRRLEAELAAEIVKQFGNTSAIKGDPIRNFVFPVDEDNKIMQDALMTMLKRDPYYNANTKDWERFPFAMQVAQNDMENLVGDLFAKYEFDDVISYIIESLKDPTIELATRGQLAKVIMARIMYSHPDVVNVIREKIYPEIAKESAKTLLALKDQSQIEGTKQPKKKKPKPGRNIVDVAELFSHDKQSQEMARILQSVEGGQEILDQMIDLNNRMRAHLVTSEEEIILGMMADEAEKERDIIVKRAEKTKDLVANMESKIHKFTEEEMKAAKTRGDFLKYQLMTRRNMKSIETTFAKIKETINKIAKEC